MELIQTSQSGSVLGMKEFFNSLTSTLGIPVNKENPPPIEVLLPLPTAPCGDVASPVIDGTWGCLLRRSPVEDRGHRQACVRLSKATWGNIIATRYRPKQG